MKRRSSKKVIVALLLVTMLSQTLYSAAASVFGLGTQSYAYADDEFTDDVEPGEEVDPSTQDDADKVQRAPESGSEEDDEDGEEVAARDDELIDEDREVVDEDAESTEDEEKEAVEIRLRASYVDIETGSAIRDTEDLDIDPGYFYIFKNEAPEIENYSYNKTTINIEDEEYDITAILTEDLDGTEIYSITTDTDIEDKNSDEISWTQLTKDAVIVLNYNEGEAEAESEEETVSDNDTVSEDEVSENEAEKRVYEYEDSRVYAKATLERPDAIPDDAVFVVKDVTGTSEADDAVAKADGATETKLNTSTARVYDIHFENEEQGEIEPEEGSVTIEIRFKKSIIAPESEEESGERAVTLVHVSDDGEANEVEADIADGGSGVSSVSFDTDSLSLYVFATNEDVKPGTSRSVASILGRAQYYGITANKLTLEGHVDANIAVGELNTDKNTTQGAYTGSGNPGNDIIASYNGSTWYADVPSKKDYTIQTTPEVEEILLKNRDFTSRDYIHVDSNHTKDELQKKVSDMIGGTMSQALADEEYVYDFASAAVHTGDSSTPYFLDLTHHEAGTYYFAFQSESYAKCINNGGPMQIKLNPDQIVVFNIPDSKVKLEQFKIDLGDGFVQSDIQNADADEYCQHVVWNLYNAEEAENGSSVIGLVLAPKGHYHIGGTSTGWLVANEVSNGGEWHMVWQEMPEDPDENEVEYNFEIGKSFDGTWPADGFTFRIESYPGDSNNTGVTVDPKVMPENTEITVYATDEGGKKSFGTMKFGAMDIYKKGTPTDFWKDENGHVRDVRYMCYMYKITEVIPANKDPNIVYDTNPWYLKLWVNAEKINNGSGDEYIVSVDAKTARSVDDGTICSIEGKQPIVFENKSARKIKLTKMVEGLSEAEKKNVQFYLMMFKRAKGSNGAWTRVSAVTDRPTHSPETVIGLKDSESVDITGWTLINKRNEIHALSNNEEYLISEQKEWNNKADAMNIAGAPDGYSVTYSAGSTVSKDPIVLIPGESESLELVATNVKKGTGNLRIHKTVVNTYSRGEIRDNVNSILESVTFKVTNVDNGFNFTFEGYVGNSGKEGSVRGSDGKTYRVTYDNHSHWTFYDIPTGTYTVEEIADGWTFGNASLHPELTRVTKYELTTNQYYGYDKNGKSNTSVNRDYSWFAKEHDRQSSNYRDAAAVVSATGDTPTVQVLNYYSTPSASIEVTKSFNGEWPAEGFSFRLTPIDGAEMTKKAGGSELINDVVTVKANGEVAKWEPIEYVGEGIRRYTISEIIPEGAKDVAVNGKVYKLYYGILYDPVSYEVQVNVNQGFWTFPKSVTIHKGGNNEYVQTIDDEYFYGVKADVTYYNRSGRAVPGAVVENKESKPVSYTPWAVKSIRYLASNVSKTLKFRLIDTDTNKVVEEIERTYTGSGVHPIFEFSPIEYTTAGIHHYRIEETENGGAAETTPSNGITFDVNVTYESDGSLKVQATNDVRTGEQNSQGARKFTNYYSLEGGAAVPVQKMLEGRNITKDDGFVIEVTKNGEDWKTFPVPYGSAVGNINVEFDKFDQKTAQDYVDNNKSDVYVFTEKNTGKAGVNYDSASFTVTVTPSIDEANGKIDVSTVKSADDIKFVNTYEASGKLQLSTKKELKGNKTLSANTFSFELKDKDGNTLQTKKNDADGNVTFDDITYIKKNVTQPDGSVKYIDQTGDYIYTVNEVIPDDAETVTKDGKEYKVKDGITYDPTVYTVNVKVTDNNTGTLNVAKSGDIEALTGTGFINTYDESGKISFKVEKEINKWTDNMKFIFKLYDGNKELKTWELDKEHQNADLYEVTVDAKEANTTHEYRLTEQTEENGLKGIKYDENPSKLLKVTWTSDGKGTLDPYYNGSKVESLGLSVKFKNSYSASGNFTPKVTKEITGMNLTREFTFQLTDVSGNVIDTQTVGAENSRVPSETKEFKTQKYTLNDDGKTYEYHIKEVIPSDAETVTKDGKTYKVKDGITYDETDHVITVALRDDGLGNIRKTVTLDGSVLSGDDPEVAVRFTNVYNTAGEGVFNARKKVTDGNNYLATDRLNLNNKFEFTLTSEDGIYTDTAKTDASGLVTFKPIKYEAPGDYNYTIVESTEDGNGYSKITGRQNVTMKVTDNGKGTLTAVPTYGTDFPEFVNKFSASANVVLGGTKTLEGKASKSMSFNFDLKPEKGQSDETKNVRSASVTYAPGTDGNKDFTFAELKYDLSDLGQASEKKFYYTITEGAVSSGVSQNGTTEYVMQVDLKLDGGKLIAEKTVKAITDNEKGFWAGLKDTLFNDGNDSVVFTNKYDAAGDIPLAGTKSFSIEDTGLSPAGFTFVVTKKGTLPLGIGDVVVAEGVSKADGTIEYTIKDGFGKNGKLEYKLADAGKTYTYEVSEADKDGFIHVRPQTFTVTVTDKGDGTLDVRGSELESLSFVNTPTSLQISKRDITTDDELEGATLTLSGNGIEPKRWESDGSNWVIYGLKDGTYTLTETSAPAGYQIARSATVVLKADNTIEVKDSEDIVKAADGSVTNLIVVNDRVLPVTITKVDENGNKLPGAVFTVTKKGSTETIPGFVDNGDGTYTLNGLATGQSYVLHEVSAPEYYATVADVEFRIDERRNIIIVPLPGGALPEGITTNGRNSITVADKPIEFYLIKDGLDNDGRQYRLKGAVFELQKDGQKIREITSDDSEGGKLVDKLVSGNYALVETSAPEGYQMSDIVTFTVKADGSIDGASYDSETRRYSITVVDPKIDFTGFHGRKKWVDGNNSAGIRPEELTITLERCEGNINHTSEWKPYTTTKASLSQNSSGQEYFFKFVSTDEYPLYTKSPRGYEYHYRIVEKAGDIPSGYTVSNIDAETGDGIAQTENGEYVITNTLKQETVSVNVAKTWQIAGTSSNSIYTGFTASLERSVDGATWAPVPGVEAKEVPKEGKIEFKDLEKYDARGFEYIYKVVETDGSRTYSWIGSTTEDYGKDIDDGKKDNTIELELLNKHNVIDVKAKVEGKKKITDNSGNKVSKPLDGFRFGLFTSADADDSAAIRTAVTNDKGEFSFGELSYNEDQRKTYTYYVREINDGKPGFEYDTKAYPVKVKVDYKDKDKKELEAKVTYNGESSVPYEITNTYNAKGEFRLVVTKSMTNDYWPQDAEFRFKVTDNGKAAGEVTLTSDLRSHTFDYEYTAEGDHEYVVTEVDKDGKELSKAVTEDGITYDDPKTIKVSFRDNESGKLIAYRDPEDTTTVITSDSADFENDYNAFADFTPSARKRTVGSNIKEDITFELTYTDRDGNVVSENRVLPASEASEGTVTFSTVSYNRSDIGRTYTYTIRELIPAEAVLVNGKYVYHGFTYDETPHTVSVSISDGHDGTLVKDIKVDDTASSNGEVLITNTYTSEGKVVLAAQKDVQTPGGNVFPRKGMNNKFSFVLKEKGTDRQIGAEKTTNDTGSVSFDEISYKLDDLKNPVREYVIEETGYEGYTPVTLTQDVKVELTDNNGEIIAVPTYANGRNDYADFINTYTVSGSVSVNVAKNFEYIDYPEEGFTFEIARTPRGAAIDSGTVKAKGDIVTFGGDYMSYDQEDLFAGSELRTDWDKPYETFYIREVPSASRKDTIAYDSKIAAVNVYVKLNNDGTMTVKREVVDSQDGETDESFVSRVIAFITGEDESPKSDVSFTNKIKRKGSLSFDAVKLLQYRDGAIVNPTEAVKADMMKLRFEVTENGKEVIPDGRIEEFVTGSDGVVNGVIRFKEITYTEPGEHEYTIKETVDTKDLAFDIDKEWLSGKKFKVSVEDPTEDEAGENFGKLLIKLDSNDSTFSITDNTIKLEIRNPMNNKIELTKRFLGVDKDHEIGEGVTLELKRMFGPFEEPVIPDGASASEWTVKSLDESRTFTGLEPGKYRLYETSHNKFSNDTVSKNGGYVDLTIDEDGCLVSEDNDTPRTEYVLANKAPNTVLIYFNLIKKWIGKATDKTDTYPRVDVKITQSVQPEDMTDGYKPKVYTETIITEKGKAEQGYETGRYPAQYWDAKTNTYKDYIYSIEEEPVEGYTAFKGTIDGAVYNGVSGNRVLGNMTGPLRNETVTFINTVENDPVEIPVKKVWKDSKSVATHPTLKFHLFADSGNGKKEIASLDLPAGKTEARFIKDSAGNKLMKFDPDNNYRPIDYTVTEDPVPGYKKGEGVQNPDGSWTFINESINAKIRKYDANDTSANPKELEGAEFTINKVGGGWSATLKSGQTLEYAIGSASGGIVPGDYEMRETKAPYGYARSSVVAHFTVAADGTVRQTDSWLKSNWNKTDGICFEDKPLYGAFRIIKVDGEDEAPLEGAEFKLYSDRAYKSGSRVLSSYIAGEDVVYELDTYTSGADGRIEIDDLPWGTYYLEETKAPAGYALPEKNIFIFDVDETHNTPDSDDYLELHYIANDKTPPPPPGSSSSTTSTSSSTRTTSSTTTTSSSTRTSTSSTTSSSVRGGTTSSSSGRYLEGVLGERKGGLLSDVLGVKKAPDAGVLGDRMSPVTGDDLTLNFWIMVLCAAGLIAMSFVYSDDDDEDEEEGEKKKRSRRRRRVRAKAKAEK